VSTTRAARTVIVSAKGAARWQAGHPWIYRTDVYDEPSDAPGVLSVTDRRGRHLGQALYSPKSEIRLRLLTRGSEPIDAAWWASRIAAAAARRAGIDATAYRAVHAEGDGLPSLVVDRYGPYIVAQLLSAGVEHAREDVIAGICAALAPEGILLRNDVAIRRHEGLPLETVPAFGTVPDVVEVEEHGVRYRAAPHTGQKTGAFLDQRENRALVAARSASGRAPSRSGAQNTAATSSPRARNASRTALPKSC
jgi:23S rRNA (cytosine1962-C5)-methyltransferase